MAVLTSPLTRADLADVALAHPVISSDLALQSRVGNDRGDVVGAQARGEHPTPSPLRHLVGHVVGVRPVAQVSDVDAGRVVTRVQHDAIRFTEVMRCYCSVGTHRVSTIRYDPVPIVVAASREDEAATLPSDLRHHLVVRRHAARESIGQAEQRIAMSLPSAVMPIAESSGLDRSRSAYHASAHQDDYNRGVI